MNHTPKKKKKKEIGEHFLLSVSCRNQSITSPFHFLQFRERKLERRESILRERTREKKIKERRERVPLGFKRKKPRVSSRKKERGRGS
jgi:hypothetical protein